MKPTAIVIVVLIAIIVGGGGFFAGMKYQQAKSGSGRLAALQGAAGGRFGGAGFGRNANFRPVMGEILSSDDKSITVKMQDGSSKIVVLSSSTSITKSATGSKSDLTSGQKVLVVGTANSDGSVTAESIQLNPVMRMTLRATTTPTQ